MSVLSIRQDHNQPFSAVQVFQSWRVITQHHPDRVPSTISLSHLLTLGPVAPSELAQQMGLDASTLTRNLRPLIDQGYAAQGPGADARSRQITLTETGRAKHVQAKQHWKRAQLSLNERLGVDQVAALHAMIEQAQSALGAAEQAGG